MRTIKNITPSGRTAEHLGVIAAGATKDVPDEIAAQFVDGVNFVYADEPTETDEPKPTKRSKPSS